MPIRLPNNWNPRDYQRPFWDYLENGGLRAIEIAHRRWGKDDVALHRAAIAAHERVASYWHCLPEYEQARKAIWSAVNPHTGVRRIDEAFPRELIASRDEQQMFIRFKNNSTWQVIGSDRYNSLVGAGVAGVTFSEWALCNPSSWGYIRPMVEENNGWAAFITTPRGKNHAKSMLDMARKNPRWFAEVSDVYTTGALTQSQLDESLAEYISLYGEDLGRAQFEQEYLCSFEAATLGAFYGGELKRARDGGRIKDVPHDPALKVHAVFDLGYTDDTAIIFFQMAGGEIRLIDAYATHGQPISHYHEVMKAKPYSYGEWLYLPHDARAKSLQTGRSIEEQFRALGWNPRIVPQLGLIDGIQAARKTFPDLWIDAEKCAALLEALAGYRREWDDDKKVFKPTPVHDWTSHYADAFRYACLVWREEMKPKEKEIPRYKAGVSIDGIKVGVTVTELIKEHRRRKENE